MPLYEAMTDLCPKRLRHKFSSAEDLRVREVGQDLTYVIQASSDNNFAPKNNLTLRKVLNVTLRRSIWIRFAFSRENKDLRKGMIALEDGHL